MSDDTVSQAIIDDGELPPPITVPADTIGTTDTYAPSPILAPAVGE
jgi:hypothetical protein